MSFVSYPQGPPPEGDVGQLGGERQPRKDGEGQFWKQKTQRDAGHGQARKAEKLHKAGEWGPAPALIQPERLPGSKRWRGRTAWSSLGRRALFLPDRVAPGPEDRLPSALSPPA